MSAISSDLLAQVMDLWPWEALAVVLAVAYLVLAIRENPWCWAAGFTSTAIYLVLFFQAKLYAASVLQLFYMGVSIYGWRQWSHPARQLRVVSWTAARHVQALGLIAILGAVNGVMLATFTSAALPYLDALISWAAVMTTWMVARKILENWIYWFAIDLASAYMYGSRGLWLTTALFLMYMVMAVIGYRSWRRRLRQPAP